jgi:hypothetical protein
MKPQKKFTVLISTLLGLGWSCPVYAASLMLDFGPTAVQPTEAQRSPGHSVGAIPGNEVTWNTVTGDTSTLLYSDGSAATGVSIDLGRSSAVGPDGNDIIDFSDNGFSVSALGGSFSTGIYTPSSPVRDGIFGGAGGTNNLAVGVRVDGLPAGTYTIYLHGRNTSTANAASIRSYAMTGASAPTYAFTAGDTTASVLNSAPAVTQGFIENDNFAVMTVNVAAGQSLFLASEGTTAAETRGFFNAIQLVSGVPLLPAVITSHPLSRTNLETGTASFAAGFAGAQPLLVQWQFNGSNLLESANVSGVNSNILTLRNLTREMAGIYTLFVSNSLGFQTSSNALLTVTPALNTEQMNLLWSLSPGDRDYLGTGSTERGLAYNSATTNLLLVSRLVSTRVIVLDPQTGAEKHFLDVSGVSGGTFSLSQIGVADDGAVFGAGLTTSATSPPLNIYRWLNDSPGNPPVLVFAGDPGLGVQPNLRWGDSMVVRGSGTDTQILLAPGTGTNVVLLRTGGTDFQTEIPPAVISVAGVPSVFARLGIAFGPGANTFWAKSAGNALYLIEFDLNSNTGTVLQSISTTLVPGSLRGIGADRNEKFLAGVAVESPNDNVRLYDISDLVSGPILRDQEAFITQNPNGNGTAAIAFGGDYLFALDTDNGIKAFLINTNYTPPSVVVTVQPTPASRTVLQGASATFTAVVSSSSPLDLRWRFNGTDLLDGPDISGAMSNVITLKNVTTNSIGNYSLFASNSFGTALSSNAVLNVVPVFNTAQMSNIWNLLPGEQTYIGTNSTERGLAYNPVTTNLLVVSRSSDNASPPTVVALDGITGVEKHFLNTSGIAGTTPGVSLGLDAIGVADDGAVYAASLTISATSPPLNIYKWPDDSENNAPILVFAGDPGASVEPNLRWSDVMAVRGAGVDTEILLSPGSGTNVALLRSNSGLDFQTEIPPAVISVSDVPSGFAQLGLTFGPGMNTFWAKSLNGALYLVQFDLNSNTGTVIRSNTFPGGLRGIAVDKTQKYLAGLRTEISPAIRLYDISDPVADPELLDHEAFATSNPNVTLGGVGAVVFGGNYLYALDSNNGIKAFLIDTNYIPPSGSFFISSVAQSSDTVILTWETVPGREYQLQYTDSLSNPVWSNFGGFVIATENTMSFTNSLPDSETRFFRIQLQ